MNRITRHVTYTKKDDLAIGVSLPKKPKEYVLEDMDLLNTWVVTSAGSSHFADAKTWLTN